MSKRRESPEGVIDGIGYEDTDAEWFAGSYIVDDPFYACDPATVIIPVNTLASMTDADIVRHVRKAAGYAEMSHASHAAFHVDYRIQHDSRAELLLLLERMRAYCEPMPHIQGAFVKIQMYLEQRTPPLSRPGWIYLVEGRDCYKIGKSKDVPTRIRTIGIQLPFQTRLIHMIPTNDMVWAEAYIHRVFADFRLNGEWFQLVSQHIHWICDLKDLHPPGGDFLKE